LTTHTTRAQLISTLEQTPSVLERLTAHLTDAELDFHPGAEEWSTREILAHLVDDEAFIMRTRLERIVKEEHPSLASHDEKHWYQHRNTSRDQVSELLHDFTVQRAASVNILGMLREDDWRRTAYHPEYEGLTAESWLDHWAEHDLIHIRQIEENLKDYQGQK
jgi:hypothetical protein